MMDHGLSRGEFFSLQLGGWIVKKVFGFMNAIKNAERELIGQNDFRRGFVFQI